MSERAPTAAAAGRAALQLGVARRLLSLGRALHTHNVLSHASAVAFQFFLSFVPLLALVGFVLGTIVRHRGVEVLMGPVFDALPAEAAELARRQLEGLAGSVSAPAAPLGVLAFFFIATTGTHHLLDVFEVMVGASRRPWWTQRSIAFAWVASVGAVVTLVAWLLVKGDTWLHSDEIARLRAAARAAREAHLPKPHFGVHHAAWENLLALAALALIALVALAALYRVGVVHSRSVARRVWPGASLAVVLGFGVSSAFAAYAQSLGRYTAYYGGLAAVAVVLVWLYLTSLALLVGAELNAQLEGVRDG